MDKLNNWIDASGITQAELARLLGTTRQAVCHWMRGRTVPALYYSLALEAVSGGQVPATVWLTQGQRLALTGLAQIAQEAGHGEE